MWIKRLVRRALEHIGRSRTGGRLLQGEMQALVSRVWLGLPGRDALEPASETQPPHRQSITDGIGSLSNRSGIWHLIARRRVENKRTRILYSRIRGSVIAAPSHLLTHAQFASSVNSRCGRGSSQAELLLDVRR
jgi:hypothetical protein